MRLCKDCKHIYDGKEPACPQCKSGNTCELHGPGIKADHENIVYPWPTQVWFFVALAGMLAYAMYLVPVAAEKGRPMGEGNLIMAACILSILIGILYVLVPRRKAKSTPLVVAGLTLVVVVLGYLGGLGAMSFLPLALLPITALCLMPHWPMMR